MILSGDATRKPWDLLMKNPHSSKDTPLKPFLLISEMKTCAFDLLLLGPLSKQLSMECLSSSLLLLKP